jgi:hypothetical protein
MNNVKPPQQVEDNDKRPHHPRAENDSKQNCVSKNKKGKDTLSVITPQPTVVFNSPGSAISFNILRWEQQKRAVDNDERCFGASH